GSWCRAGSPPSSATICLTGWPLMPPLALIHLAQICTPSAKVLMGAPAGPEFVPTLPMMIGLPLAGAAGAAGVGTPGFGAAPEPPPPDGPASGLPPAADGLAALVEPEPALDAAADEPAAGAAPLDVDAAAFAEPGA